MSNGDYGILVHLGRKNHMTTAINTYSQHIANGDYIFVCDCVCMNICIYMPGSQSFFSFMHPFVMVKLATNSIRVKNI